RGLVVVEPELPLEEPVDAAHLLLLAQAESVLRKLEAPLAVLTGRIRTPRDRALLREAALTLQVELAAFATAELADRTEVPCHSLFSQTRRRLGGRQPLCGMGVTSRTSVTRKPAD